MAGTSLYRGPVGDVADLDGGGPVRGRPVANLPGNVVTPAGQRRRLKVLLDFRSAEPGEELTSFTITGDGRARLYWGEILGLGIALHHWSGGTVTPIPAGVASRP
ncbi:MAG: hypothetical protein WKF43_14850 [Acidimicrobiales bacterium]